MRQIAINFYSWLIDMGYCDKEDMKLDIDDMTEDFENAFEVAPRLINLLRDISER